MGRLMINAQTAQLRAQRQQAKQPAQTTMDNTINVKRRQTCRMKGREQTRVRLRRRHAVLGHACSG